MKHILILILILTTLSMAAQNNYSPCYTDNIAKGDSVFKQGKYNEARTYYATAKQCNGGNPQEAQRKINLCNDKINPTLPKVSVSTDANGNHIFTVGNATFKMMYVKGGSFTMGCNSGQDGDCSSREEPEHQVTVGDFYMGETEVTQALWKAVMGTEPSYNGGWTNEYGRGISYPAYRVSWDDCQEFIRKLNALTGKTFRLPTEAEWEYAARGGTHNSKYRYAGSDNFNAVAWGSDNSGWKIHPVKIKEPNEQGLYDMSGNVQEWCSDWYGSYSSSSQTDPAGPLIGVHRVCRGGSWCYNSLSCLVFHRSIDIPDKRDSAIGFRLSLVY